MKLYLATAKSIETAIAKCRQLRIVGITREQVELIHAELTGARNVVEMKQQSPEYNMPAVLQRKIDAISIVNGMRLALGTREIEMIVDACVEAIKESTSLFSNKCA